MTPAASTRRKRQTYGLATATTVLFLFFAAAAAPSPLLPLLLQQWRFDSWLLTFAFAVYALAILAALLVVGRLSDHIGRRPVILWATAAELISIVLFLLSQDIGVFIVARTLQGLATGAATGALSAAIADYAGERRSPLAATLSSVGPLAGLAAGAVFAGIVEETSTNPKPTVFAVFSVLCVLAVVGASGLRESTTPRPGARHSLIPRVAVPPAARSAFWRAVPVAIAVWMVGGFYLSVVGETSREILAISDELTVSLLIAGLSAAGAITAAVTRTLRTRTKAAAGSFLIALGMVINIMSLHQELVPLLAIGTVISGAGFGMAFAGAVALVIPHARAHERGELFSAIYVVNYLAFGVPAIVAGLLIAPLGLDTAVFAYAAAVVVLAAFGVFVQTTPTRATHHRPSPATPHS